MPSTSKPSLNDTLRPASESIWTTAKRVIDKAIDEICQVHPEYDTRVACSMLVAEGLRRKLLLVTDVEHWGKR